MKNFFIKIVSLSFIYITQPVSAEVSQKNVKTETSLPYKKSVKIETSLPYIKELVQQASCFSKSFQIESIIATGTDPHTFRMSPKSRIAIAKSDVIIFVGADLEPWLLRIPQGKEQTWLELSKGMNLRKLEESKHDDHETEKDEAHHHLDYDPHIWQSPELTKQALKKISLTLQSLKPDESENIKKCTQDYIQTIDSEVISLKKEISKIPEKQRIIATNHDALGYFADEFGFRILSITGLSDESSPTPEQLKKIILGIKKENVKAVFLESTGNMRNIQTVSKETGVKIGGELFADSLGGKGSHAETALTMWRTNIKTILSAIKN